MIQWCQAVQLCVQQIRELHEDADPEEEEHGTEPHEDGGHGGDQHLLLQLPGEFCGRHLVDEEPRGEEETNPQ